MRSAARGAASPREWRGACAGPSTGQRIVLLLLPLLLLLLQEEMGRLVDSARLRIAEELTEQANAKLRAAQQVRVGRGATSRVQGSGSLPVHLYGRPLQEFMSRVGTETARRLEALDALRAETGATEALLQARLSSRANAAVARTPADAPSLMHPPVQAREEYERRARRVQKVALATLALLQVGLVR